MRRTFSITITVLHPSTNNLKAWTLSHTLSGFPCVRQKSSHPTTSLSWFDRIKRISEQKSKLMHMRSRKTMESYGLSVSNYFKKL